jgi:hypothetical protein
MVKLIAMQEMKVAGKTWGPMPEGAKGREASYIFELPTQAAAALVRKGRCQPAYTYDENLLRREANVICRAAFGKAPKSSGKAPAPEKPGSGVDMAAALSGTKSEMKAACEALGLDTGGTKSELRARLEAQ